MATPRERMLQKMNQIREEKGLPAKAYAESKMEPTDPYKLPNSVELKELPIANTATITTTNLRNKYLKNPNNADVMYYSKYNPNALLGKFIKQETSNLDHYTYFVFENGSVKSEFPIYYNTPVKPEAPALAPTGGRKTRTKKNLKRKQKKSRANRK